MTDWSQPFPASTPQDALSVSAVVEAATILNEAIATSSLPPEGKKSVTEYLNERLFGFLPNDDVADVTAKLALGSDLPKTKGDLLRNLMSAKDDFPSYRRQNSYPGGPLASCARQADQFIDGITSELEMLVLPPEGRSY